MPTKSPAPEERPARAQAPAEAESTPKETADSTTTENPTSTEDLVKAMSLCAAFISTKGPELIDRLQKQDLTEKEKEDEPEYSDWLEDVPMPTCGSLTLWSEDGDNLQEIHLDVAEFNELKRHLLMTGRGPDCRSSDWQRVLKNGVEGLDREHQQLAIQLEIARAFYKAFPRLVVANEPPPEMERLLKQTYPDSEVDDDESGRIDDATTPTTS